MDKKTKIIVKTGAKISMIILLLATVGQFVSAYQTSYQLVTPVIPKSTIWEINKQFIFIAFIFTITSLLSLVLYFYEKYLWIIIMIVLILIGSRFIYI
jgi:hypothetical protein